MSDDTIVGAASSAEAIRELAEAVWAAARAAYDLDEAWRRIPGLFRDAIERARAEGYLELYDESAEFLWENTSFNDSLSDLTGEPWHAFWPAKGKVQKLVEAGIASHIIVPIGQEPERWLVELLEELDRAEHWLGDSARSAELPLEKFRGINLEDIKTLSFPDAVALMEAFSPSHSFFGDIGDRLTKSYRLLKNMELVCRGRDQTLRIWKAEPGIATDKAASQQLTTREGNIIEALGDKTLTAEQISRESGYPNNSSFRELLSQMVKRGIIVRAKGKSGYRKA